MTDFHAALDVLKRFNAFVAQDEALSRLLLDGEYNFLQGYQFPLFLALTSKKIDHGTRLESGKSKAGAAVRARQAGALGISLLSWLYLLASRRQVLLFAADKHTVKRYLCDFRMESMYRYLFSRNVRFVEVLHTLYAPGFLGDALRRGRPAVYAESVDMLYGVFSGLGVVATTTMPPSVDFRTAGTDEAVFRQLADMACGWVGRSRFRVRAYRVMLKLSAVRVLVATSDTRNYNELVAACNSLGIETHAFQSGNLNKYDVGYLDYGAVRGRLMKPRYFYAESDYWKRELIRLGTYFAPDEVRIGGNMKEDFRATSAEELRLAGDAISVLVPYEIVAPKKDVLAFINACIRDPRITVIFKFRGDRDPAAQIREYGLEVGPANLRLIANLNEVDGFDVVAGTYSTYLYEMIGALKPVGYIPSSFDWGEGLVRNGLVNVLSFSAPLYEQLDALRRLPLDERLARREQLYGNAVPLADTLGEILA